jgi:succinate-acetate transporter protein
VLYAPINLVFFLFSSIMVYLTAYRNTTLCALHAVITVTFFTTFLAHLDILSELLPGIFHILVGLMAFYHAVASLTFAFTGHSLLPLGPALLHHRVSRAHS